MFLNRLVFHLSLFIAQFVENQEKNSEGNIQPSLDYINSTLVPQTSQVNEKSLRENIQKSGQKSSSLKTVQVPFTLPYSFLEVVALKPHIPLFQTQKHEISKRENNENVINQAKKIKNTTKVVKLKKKQEKEKCQNSINLNKKCAQTLQKRSVDTKAKKNTRKKQNDGNYGSDERNNKDKDKSQDKKKKLINKNDYTSLNNSGTEVKNKTENKMSLQQNTKEKLTNRNNNTQNVNNNNNNNNKNNYKNNNTNKNNNNNNNINNNFNKSKENNNVSPLCPTECYCPETNNNNKKNNKSKNKKNHKLEQEKECLEDIVAVRDGCNCCFICPRQRGDICDHRSICDASRGLYCDFDAGPVSGVGICRARKAHSCQLSTGEKYKDGEMILKNCSVTCQCQDGLLVCVNSCPTELIQPHPSPHCPHPKLTVVKGRCCKEWVCYINHHPSLNNPNDVVKDEDGEDNDFSSNYSPTMKQNKIVQTNDKAEYIIDVQNKTNIDINSLKKDEKEAQNKHTETLESPEEEKNKEGTFCKEETTNWSSCSRSCDMGWSVRQKLLANCSRVDEQRLCMIRPCSWKDKHMTGKECKNTYRQEVRMRYKYQNCISIKQYLPKFCGTCKKHRCCLPDATKTITVKFHCPNRTDNKKIMWIKSCKCKDFFCERAVSDIQ